MREIKFRAWDKIHKEMSTWSSLYDNPNLWEYILSHNEQFENWIGDIVLMQYTGLKDKNGTEIYEGDILLFNNSHNGMNKKWKCVVKYRGGSFVCEYPVDGVYNHFDSWNVPKVTWEVIGNIYENPELLEEKQ